MNSTSPLDQLKDIHLPEPVSWWPPALGWWLMTAVIMALLVACFWVYKRWQKKAYRRSAIQNVNQLFNQQSPTLAADLNRLLKAVAQQSYSTLEVSRLSASEWLIFLDNSADMQAFCAGPGQALATAPYEKKPAISNPDKLKTCCIQWIRRHK